VTHKRKLRGIAILITLAFLLSLLPAGMASAATGYTALTKPTVGDGDWVTLGTVIAEVPVEALSGSDTVVLSLPSGFKFYDGDANVTVSGDTYELQGSLGGHVKVSAPDYVGGKKNGIKDVTEFNVVALSKTQLQIKVTGASETSPDAAFLKIELTSVYVKSGFTGDITLTADAPSTSAFPDGSVVVGRASAGDVTISVTDDQTSNSDFEVTIRIKESRAGSLKDKSDSIKLILPDGFVWDDSVAANDPDVYTQIWGTDVLNDCGLSFSYDDEELKIGLTNTTTSALGGAACFELTLAFYVDDESRAKYGEVTAKVRGSSSISPSEIVVGTYGDFGVTIEADDPTVEVFAGLKDQEVSDIVIKESLKGSLIDGRTVLLTLPANARWNEVNGQVPYDELRLNDAVCDYDNGVRLVFKGLTGTNNRTLKLAVDGDSSDNDAAELTIEDITVNLEAGVTGDLKVQVSGSAGLSGEITIAKVLAPVTATANVTDVKLGLSGQAAGDITITETKAGAILEDYTYTNDDGDEVTVAAEIVLDLPDGVKFTVLPKVEVVSGDLKIDAANVKRANNDNELVIPIDNDSNEASTIKISGIQYTLDRTVPEGDLQVKIKGTALVETGGTWPNSTTAAKVVNAKVVTPAPGEVKGTAVLQIGSTTMKVNGVDVEMDVAPYLKNSRTYVSARFCANALGIDNNNIMWDGATKTATIIAGAKVIQLKVGSTVMVINGANIQMDTAPELVPPGRVMLPIGWLAWALGAETSWDNETQTATLEL